MSTNYARHLLGRSRQYCNDMLMSFSRAVVMLDECDDICPTLAPFSAQSGTRYRREQDDWEDCA